MENNNPIPVRKMKVKLKKANPTRLTPENLQKQMYGIGLHCESTSIENLTKYKAEVLQELFTSGLQACEIAKPSNGFSEAAFLNGKLGGSDEPYIDGAVKLVDVAIGEWVWDDTAAGYQEELSAVQIPANFDYLKKNRPGFAGRVKKVEVKKQLTSVDAIKGLYIETASAASETLSEHINKDSVEAFFSNVISPLGEGEVSKDYQSSESVMLFLTLNHVGDYCDGMGVINISYDINIKNYQRKSKDGGDYHDTHITVMCRGVFYSSENVLIGDFEALKNSFKNARYLMTYPKEPVPVTVFDTLPPAGHEAFVQGIPSALTDTYTDSIILHSPYVEELKAVDSVGSQGFFLKNADFPRSEINYVIKAPASDVLGAASAAPIRLTDAHQHALVKKFENPVDLRRTVYKADILRHSIEDGSYKYIESGEYYCECTGAEGETAKVQVLLPAKDIKNEWRCDDQGFYQSELFTIANPMNFDYLISNCPQFNGNKKSVSVSRQLVSMEDFRELFVDVSKKVISTLKPIESSSLEQLLSSIASVFMATGYTKSDRVLFMSLNRYGDCCDGAGVIRLSIDVNNKDSGRGHIDARISIEARGAFYTSVDELYRDYDMVKSVTNK